MNKIILNIISFMHLMLILFVVGVPLLSNDITLLAIHVWVIPFILLHWSLNDNQCAVVTMEKKLRKEAYGENHDIYNEDCISCKLIEPVYDFHKKMEKHKIHNVLFIVTMILWLISANKINNKYENGEISCIIKEIKNILMLKIKK